MLCLMLLQDTRLHCVSEEYVIFHITLGELVFRLRTNLIILNWNVPSFSYISVINVHIHRLDYIVQIGRLVRFHNSDIVIIYH